MRTRSGMRKVTCAGGLFRLHNGGNWLGGFAIPQVTIKTGLTTPDGCEELLTEYLCDHPGCPNIATQALGCVREVGAVAAVCDEHAAKPRL